MSLDSMLKKAKEELSKNVITISEDDFVKASAKATSNDELMKSLVEDMPSLYLVLMLHAKAISNELFHKDEKKEESEEL